MVMESNGYSVREERLWCSRVTVVVSECNAYNVIPCSPPPPRLPPLYS
jgi:hypothetical protein